MLGIREIGRTESWTGARGGNRTRTSLSELGILSALHLSAAKGTGLQISENQEREARDYWRELAPDGMK